jgi:DNA-binding NarL/FixJ family response regulator
MAGRKGILIVDEHPLFREGVKATVARIGTFVVLGEAGKALEALRLAVELGPSIVERGHIYSWPMSDTSLRDHGSGVTCANLPAASPQATLIISLRKGLGGSRSSSA